MYRKVAIGILAFSLFNSSDVFHLLKAKQSGSSDTIIICICTFDNLIYAVFAISLGILVDRIGLNKMLISGIRVQSQHLCFHRTLFSLWNLCHSDRRSFESMDCCHYGRERHRYDHWHLFCFSMRLHYGSKLLCRTDLVSI